MYRARRRAASAVTREGAGLFLQATGQPRFPLFAEAEGRFFLQVVDAQVEFTKDSAGAVDALILVQGGGRQRGARVK